MIILSENNDCLTIYLCFVGIAMEIRERALSDVKPFIAIWQLSYLYQPNSTEEGF